MTQKSLQRLFEKKMDRKEFLLHIGAAVLAIIGVSGLLKNLISYNPRSRSQPSVGYGKTNYGGRKR